jgi:hypothetical protein
VLKTIVSHAVTVAVSAVLALVVGWALFYKPVVGSLSDQLAVWSAKFSALVKAQADGLSAISSRLGDTDGTIKGIIDSIGRRDAENRRLGGVASASTASALATTRELRRLLEAASAGDSESEAAGIRNEEFGRRAAQELGISGP